MPTWASQEGGGWSGWTEIKHHEILFLYFAFPPSYSSHITFADVKRPVSQLPASRLGPFRRSSHHRPNERSFCINVGLSVRAMLGGKSVFQCAVGRSVLWMSPHVVAEE